jgi:acid phosphatase family membrane protein YuiD
MKEFFLQAPYLVALSAGFLVQIGKFLAHLVRHREVNFTRLVGTGGLPSAHSASVAALSTSVGFLEGVRSTLFGVTLFFSLVIMYDAAGLRRAAGLQARVLNRIVADHYAHRPHLHERLSELLGHTPFEVFVGAALGVIYGLVLYQ